MASCRRATAFLSPSDEPALRADEDPLDGARATRTGLGRRSPGRQYLIRTNAPVTKAPKTRRTLRPVSALERSWFSRFAVGAAAFLLAPAAAYAGPSAILPLVPHRAAYELSLAEPASAPPSSPQTPVAASGLIAYEFRGSACEGYTSNFRQMTQMERSEGEPLSMDVNAMSFEDANGNSMRFQVDTKGTQQSPPVAGTATRRSERRHAGRIDEAGAENDRFRP